MNSFLTRLNGVFSFTLSAMAAVTLFCFLSTVLKDRAVPGAEVKLSRGVTVKKIAHPQTRVPNDLVDLQVEINADFSDLFDWNVKQLFVYVVANFETTEHPVNEVVIWDKIILRGEEPVIKLSSASVEYYLLDHGTGLLGNNNVTLQLCWNVIPLAGRLPLVKSKASRMTLPTQYSHS